jgi:formiminotetrahydrofolate cyclodeaminase
MAAYESYRAALALPKTTADEKVARSQALAAARERSTAVPERILAASRDTLQQIDALSNTVNPNLAGDVASAAYFLEACARGAAIQVFSNCAAADSTGANANAARKPSAQSSAARTFATKFIRPCCRC